MALPTCSVLVLKVPAMLAGPCLEAGCARCNAIAFAQLSQQEKVMAHPYQGQHQHFQIGAAAVRQSTAADTASLYM